MLITRVTHQPCVASVMIHWAINVTWLRRHVLNCWIGSRELSHEEGSCLKAFPFRLQGIEHDIVFFVAAHKITHTRTHTGTSIFRPVCQPVCTYVTVQLVNVPKQLIPTSFSTSTHTHTQLIYIYLREQIYKYHYFVRVTYTNKSLAEGNASRWKKTQVDHVTANFINIR